MNYVYEAELTGYLFEQLQQIPNRTYFSKPKIAGLGRAALAAFTAGDVHPDLSTILDQAGVAIRAGHHCLSHSTPLLGCSVHGTGKSVFHIPAKRLTCLLHFEGSCRVLAASSVNFVGWALLTL